MPYGPVVSGWPIEPIRNDYSDLWPRDLAYWCCALDRVSSHGPLGMRHAH